MDIKACLLDGREIKYYSNTYEKPLSKKVEGGMVRFETGERFMIPTGLILEIPFGYSVRIYNRSGNAFKYGYQLCNSVGVIDWDYRNELMVLLHNTSIDSWITHGERIAQMELVKVNPVELVELSEVSEAGTERVGGFGSTGS